MRLQGRRLSLRGCAWYVSELVFLWLCFLSKCSLQVGFVMGIVWGGGLLWVLQRVFGWELWVVSLAVLLSFSEVMGEVGGGGYGLLFCFGVRESCRFVGVFVFFVWWWRLCVGGLARILFFMGSVCLWHVVVGAGYWCWFVFVLGRGSFGCCVVSLFCLVISEVPYVSFNLCFSLGRVYGFCLCGVFCWIVGVWVLWCWELFSEWGVTGFARSGVWFGVYL